MAESIRLDVEEIEWDAENIEHCALHKLTPEIVEEVRLGEPRYFLNAEGKTGSHVMIGPIKSGQIWTVILLELGGGKYRPITGWRSENREIRRYRSES
jgi:hypothetical protein